MSFVIFVISVLVLEFLLARFAPLSKRAPSIKDAPKSKAATSGN